MSRLPEAPEIAPSELVARIEAGEEIHILDVRAPERLATARVDLVAPPRFHNIRGSQVIALRDPRAAGLPDDALIAVVCGLGNDSRVVAEHLRARGLRATSLAGGLAAWAHVVIPRPLAPDPSLDAFVQGDRVAKGALSYALVSEGEAVLVDPPRHAGALLDVLARDGARLVAVCDTHVHADYVSGAPTLARRHDVPYHLHPKDAVSPYDGTAGRLDFVAAADGAELRFGRARLVARHTPGHTEGSVTWTLEDRVALTGDFLFVASAGRPDLGGQAERWTTELFDSLRRARDRWPPSMRILPAHYASERERGPTRAVEARFGDLLEGNEPLGLTDARRFAAWVERRSGAFPDAYRRIKHVNLGLETASDEELDVLEAGRNECALG